MKTAPLKRFFYVYMNRRATGVRMLRRSEYKNRSVMLLQLQEQHYAVICSFQFLQVFPRNKRYEFPDRSAAEAFYERAMKRILRKRTAA